MRECARACVVEPDADVANRAHEPHCSGMETVSSSARAATLSPPPFRQAPYQTAPAEGVLYRYLALAVETQASRFYNCRYNSLACIARHSLTQHLASPVSPLCMRAHSECASARCASARCDGTQICVRLYLPLCSVRVSQAQIEKTCVAIQADAKLANGFNIVGLSQVSHTAR